MRLSNRVVAWTGLLSLVLVILLGAVAPKAQAATLPKLSGTYQTLNKTGTITFAATRIFARIGYGGWVQVDGGRRQWGVMVYNGDVYGLTWYYGKDSTYPQAGTTYPLKLAGNKYVGPIQFTDRAGNIIDSGSVSFTLK